MKPLRIAVIGGGHLGTIHAKLLARVPQTELVAIVEPSDARARQLAAEFDCRIVSDVESFLSHEPLDAAVVAAPTSLHWSVGRRLLARGIHTLMEKPLAPTNEECEQLVAAASQSGAILQVGHVERFNPAWSTIRNHIDQPRLVEAVREGPLTFRSMDTGVVLDLMIHDIDLVLSLVQSPVVSVQASGFHWTGDAEDVAHARLTFANGCVARLSASRVSRQPRREMRLYGTDWLADIDFANRHCQVIRAPEEPDLQSRNYSPTERQLLMETLFTSVLPTEEPPVPEANPILDELSDFVTSITTSSEPIVTGRDGQHCVEVANQIRDRIARRVSTRPDVRPMRRRAG